MRSHQSCEDERFGEKAEGSDRDEEDEAEDDEKMSGRVLRHRTNQVEKEQVLENKERIFQIVHQRIRVQDKEPGVETVAEIFGWKY